MRSYLFLLTIFVFLFFKSTVHAVTVYVPDDFDTIQAGIDACTDGDTVIVRDGTYTGDGNRFIDFYGKAIVVMSENGPESCIIDCEGRGRGFYFHSGEDSTSILQGFTITNGSGSFTPFRGWGGGILCENSSPTIIGNMISGNVASGFSSANGGGIACSFSSPTIIGNTISGNVASSVNYSSGGGIYLENSDPFITNNIILENIVTEGDGGGIYCSYSSPTITCNTISGNIAEGFGFYGDGGGGIYCYHSSPIITSNTISGNDAPYGEGGGIYNYYSSPTVTNCTLIDNSSNEVGGGMSNWSNSYPIVTNCILWGDLPNEISNNDSDPIITYSNIEGGYVGEGNIDFDPRFVSFHDFDFLLHPTSPCVDTGDPSIEDSLYDWHPRWPNWYPNSSRSDMGAYGGPGNLGWL